MRLPCWTWRGSQLQFIVRFDSEIVGRLFYQ
jgi:hypothetical protein